MNEFITTIMEIFDGMMAILDGMAVEAAQPISGGGPLVGAVIAIVAIIAIKCLFADRNRGQSSEGKRRR